MRNTWENEAAAAGRTTKPAVASGKARTPPGTTGKAARRSRSGQDCAGAAGRRTRSGDPQVAARCKLRALHRLSTPSILGDAADIIGALSGPRALRVRRARPPYRGHPGPRVWPISGALVGFVLPSLTMAPNPLAVLRASSTFVGDLPALAEQLTNSIGDLSGLIAEQVSVTREQVAATRDKSPPPANKSPRRRRCGRRRLRCAGNSL